MAEIGALRTRISLDSAQFEQGMAGINRQLRSLKQEQRAVTSSGTGFARGLTEMRSKADVLSRTLELQQAKVHELKRRYDEAREATGENSRETQRAQEQYNRAVAEMNKTETALKNLTAEIERQSSPWTRLGENMEETGERLQTIGRGISDFGRGWSMRVTAPLLGAGAAALKVGMDFEAGMSQVQALSQATSDEMEKLSGMAKDLGETTRFSAKFNWSVVEKSAA